MENRHVLLVTFPAQGHINPSLQFAKKLIKLGIHVTFGTSLSVCRRMADTKGLTFLGFDDGYKLGDDPNMFIDAIRSHGSTALRGAIAAAAEEGRPVTCLVYTLILPWATKVARELHIPSAELWIQPATVFTIYYHYFNFPTKSPRNRIIQVGKSKSPELRRSPKPTFPPSPSLRPRKRIILRLWRLRSSSTCSTPSRASPRCS